MPLSQEVNASHEGGYASRLFKARHVSASALSIPSLYVHFELLQFLLLTFSHSTHTGTADRSISSPTASCNHSNRPGSFRSFNSSLLPTKMKLGTFGILTPFLAALSTLATTSPLDSRATDGVWICPEKNWKGTCDWVQAWESATLCRGFAFTTSQYFSFGPDGDVTCTVFTDENCKTVDDGSDSRVIAWPGDGQIPGPAYAGGQGTAHSPAHHAYKCHPNSSKRETSPGKEGINGDSLGDTQINVESNNGNLEARNHNAASTSPRGNASLPLRATSAPPGVGATFAVWLCPQINWGGVCTWTPISLPIRCYTLPLDWDVFSFGPSRGITCSLYANAKCETLTIDGLQVNYPGFAGIAGPAYSGGGDYDRGFAYSCWRFPSNGENDADDEADNNSKIPITNAEISEFKSRTVTSRAEGGVYVCQLPQWQGQCDWLTVQATDEVHAQCLPFPYSTSSSSISFGPDKGVVCKAYIDIGCVVRRPQDFVEITTPGSSDLTKHATSSGVGWAKFKCWQPDDSKVTAPSTAISGANTRSITPRGELGLYTCAAAHWQGFCSWLPVTDRDELNAPCYPLPFPDQSSISFGPDRGVMCKVYLDLGCARGSLGIILIQSPGASQMSKQSSTQASGSTRFKCWLI